MNRTDRLMAIVWLLRSRRKMSAAQLAEAFGVGERTIYRDVQALSEAGVPVAALPGPGGGYALADGYRLSPIAFGTEEVEALWIAGRLVSGLGLAEADGALQSALAKILALSDPERVAHVTQLDRHLDVQLERRGAGTLRPDVFATLRQAVLEHKTVHLEYGGGATKQNGGAWGQRDAGVARGRDAGATKQNGGAWEQRDAGVAVRSQRDEGVTTQPSERDVTPERLLFQRGAWYIQGADSASGEVRTFRVDRITACALTDKPAIAAAPAAQEPPLRVVLRLADHAARWYSDHPVYRDWNPRQELAGYLTLDAPPVGINSLIATVLSGAGEEVVVEPAALVQRIAGAARGAYDAHAALLAHGNGTPGVEDGVVAGAGAGAFAREEQSFQARSNP